jgi:diguanylate cyclase
MSAAAPTSLSALVLGPPGHQRVRVSQVLLALAIYVVFAAVQHGEVVLGLIELADSNRLTLFNLSGTLLFYVAIRSGFNERFTADPALTVPQMVFGILSTVGSYAVTGPARGAVLSLLVLILVFGMFALSPRQARGLALLAVVALGAVMLWKSRSDPARYPPATEAVHFLFGVIVLAGVSALSVRMGALRGRLKAQKDALGVQKAELEQALEQIRLLATQDELTGLFNRRHMTALLDHQRAQQQRSGVPICLVLIDIDLFKRINDTHGHQAGDTVLRRFAQAGRGALRASDVLARWGGEEFLLMLPDTTAAQALVCVERLRASVANLCFDDIAPGLAVTFSAGLSLCADADRLDTAIEAADQAMYRAKTQGRNCTVSAPVLV